MGAHRPPETAGPRLAYADPDAPDADAALVEAAAQIRARRSGGRLLNLDRMLLHSPPLAAGWSALLGAVRGRLALRPGLRELVICAIARLNDAPYEWLQHIGEWEAAGARPDQVRALQGDAAGWLQDPAFDRVERLALDLSIQMTRQVAVQPAVLAELEGLLGGRVTVELVGTVAAYNMVSRFLVALGVTAAGESGSPR
jgi:alkylhydroperoxidase family enzyme